MKKHLKKWRVAYLCFSLVCLCWIPIFEPALAIYFHYLPMRYRFDWLNFAFALPAGINLVFLIHFGIKDYEEKN